MVASREWYPPSSDQGVQLPFSDAFQLTSPQRLEPEAGARDEVLHGARHEDLAASGRGADARADRQRNPGDLSFVQLALAGVDADPHLDPDGADRVQDGLRAADRARGTVERREEPVP